MNYHVTYVGSQMIIDTHVEEICTLCGEENTSGSLLVLRFGMYTFMCVVEFF